MSYKNITAVKSLIINVFYKIIYCRYIYTLWAGVRIPPLFLCVSYEVTKRVSRRQCVYSLGLCQDVGPKHCHHSQTSRALSHGNFSTHGATCC